MLPVFPYFGSLPMAIDAMLATIAYVGQEIYSINREAGRNKLIYSLIYYFIPNPLMVALANPFRRGTWGGVCSAIKTMPLTRQTAPSWWGCLCAVCFAS
jgi:hypothetical protein